MQETNIPFKNLERCLLCNDPFQRNQQKLPRVLFCGHNLCSDCIKNEIIRNRSLTCPYLNCSKNYSQQACSQFQINYFYLDMIEYLQQQFGTLTVPNNLNLEAINQNQLLLYHGNTSLTENQGEIKKCKNSQCWNQTEFIFCSQQCQFHFEEAQTKKNSQGSQFNRRSGDFMNEF